MKRLIIDSHIHFEKYDASEQEKIIHDFKKDHIHSLITVSSDLQSCQENLSLSQMHDHVYPAFGYHPEQDLPTKKELVKLLNFIDLYHDKMIAIGEVGLPHYLRRKQSNIPLKPYIELLTLFIKRAVLYDKPIILHAVYEDAPIVCDLLEKYDVKQAHFHWFKGEDATIERMIERQYVISITPDVLYEEKIQRIVQKYPLALMLVETDGPWPFEGPFENRMTQPKMIHRSIEKIAHIKEKPIEEVYETIFQNTIQFYSI